MARLSSCIAVTATHVSTHSVLPPPRHGHSLGLSQRTNSCKALANPVSSKALRVTGFSCPKQRHWKHTANCMPSLAGSCTVLCKDLKDSVHLCLSCRHTAFIPFCDEGNSPEGTLNCLRTFALQVSSTTPNCFDYIKTLLTSVLGGSTSYLAYWPRYND